MRSAFVTGFGCLALAGSPLLAGVPHEETLVCPIGNETVEVVGTSSCTYGMATTMSLRSVSSCDFVTRLPVCPSSGIPLYAEFPPAATERLKAFIETDGYRESLEASRYLRAYLIDLELNLLSDQERFWMLQDGHFYDAGTTFGDAAYFRAYQTALDKALEATDDENAAFMRAMAAYASFKAGDEALARDLMAAAETLTGNYSETIKAYIALLDACLGRPNAEECQPEYEIDLPF